MASYLNPDLSYDRKAVALEAYRIARRGASLGLTPGAWQRIAWGKAKAELNQTIMGLLTLRMDLAIANGVDPRVAMLEALAGA